MAEREETALDGALDEATRDLVRKEMGLMTDHPSNQELLDYQEGRVGTEAAEALLRHLSFCRDCADDLLELEDWDSRLPEDGASFPTPASMAARRLAFEKRVAVSQSPGGQASRPWRVPASLAAGLAAASLVLGFLLGGFGLGGLGSSESTSSAPVDRPFVSDLVPDGATPVRAGIDPEVRVPAGMNPLVLRLNLGDQAPHDTYRADLHAASGEAIRSFENLVRQPAGSFAVLLDLDDLAPGSYRLSLSGRSAGAEAVLAVYSFDLSYPPSL